MEQLLKGSDHPECSTYLHQISGQDVSKSILIASVVRNTW